MTEYGNPAAEIAGNYQVKKEEEMFNWLKVREFKGTWFRDLRLFLILFFTLFAFHCSLSTASHAAHPLITDDTGTQSKGKFQLEINSEFFREKEIVDGIAFKEAGGEIATVLSYGVADNVDIVLGFPYQWFKVKEDGITTEKESGISDISLEVKWRFFEQEGFSLAVKPGVTLPTGDDKKGLGSGKATYSLYLIATKEIEPFAFHLNAGYIRNENKHDERKDIWHASLAAEAEVIKDLKAAANIGIERNTDRASNSHPAFILGGLIYSITENIDIDVGIKGGLNKPETDLTFLAGIALRF